MELGFFGRIERRKESILEEIRRWDVKEKRRGAPGRGKDS